MELLTRLLYQQLLDDGYQYFLLKGVSRIEPGIPAHYVLQPKRYIPAVQIYSCLGIADEMILSVLNGERPHIILYLE